MGLYSPRFPKIQVDSFVNYPNAANNIIKITVEEWQDLLHHTHKVTDILDTEGNFIGSDLDISVSGGVSPYGIGGKGSLPKFSVSWYNKGYDEAQILRSATIFGVTNGGQLLGGGESGNEVVVGEQHLLDMIAKTQRENSVGGTIVINVYGAEGQSEEKIADRVIDKLSRMTNNRRVVYA
jgi:hypothetical protein